MHLLSLLLAGALQVKVCLAKFHDSADEQTSLAEENREHVRHHSLQRKQIWVHAKCCFRICIAAAIKSTGLSPCLSLGPPTSQMPIHCREACFCRWRRY